MEVKALETLDIWKVISWVPVLRIFLDGFCRDAFPRGFLKFRFTRLDGDILAYLIPPALGKPGSIWIYLVTSFRTTLETV
jgi:hypothetical protein